MLGFWIVRRLVCRRIGVVRLCNLVLVERMLRLLVGMIVVWGVVSVTVVPFVLDVEFRLIMILLLIRVASLVAYLVGEDMIRRVWLRVCVVVVEVVD